MTMLIDQKSLSRILHWTQFLVLACAAAMLAYSAFVLMATKPVIHQI
jgi:hypothetical protein